MTQSRTFVQNLMHRRVPQLVGMYVAATWLVIELGDWITGRFNLPSSLTTYVFVAMLLMLPAAALFFYNHGAPGRDAWTTTEKAVIPLNGLLVMGVLYFMSPLLSVEAATETVRIPDETGVLQEFKVVRQGYHKDVVGFFWRNDSGDADLDWLSYGLPLMLAHDLNRVSPVITVETPFDSYAMRNELRNRGYAALLDEPQGLRVEIARDRRSAALIVGSFTEVDGRKTLHASLIDAVSGSEIGSHSVTGNDWLAAVDEVTVALLDYLKIEPADNQSDDPLGQHFSESLDAIRHFTIGQVALDINNDYPQGIAELESALAIDPEFAEASGELSVTYYLSNDLPSAREAASQALKNSYRLSETSKFVLKANRYIYNGDYDRGERVVEIWTQVQPNSTQAFRSMARLNRLRGTNASLQRAIAAYDRLLELDPMDVSILRDKAEVEQQRGDYAAAADYLLNFLEQEPASDQAHLQLAGIYQALGDLEAAQASLEDAAILSENPVDSEVGLARLEARRGLFDAAEQRLERQLDAELSPQDRVDLLSALTEISFVRGRIERAIELHDEVGTIAAGFMPPMVRLMRIDIQQATLLSLLGRTDEALAAADRVLAQLQAPMDAYVNFTYATIYRTAGNRAAYREIAERTAAGQDQLPPIVLPFVEMQQAQVAIWDQDTDAALPHLERASELLGQSMIHLFRDNLSTASMYVMLAELYLDANASDDARQRLDDVLTVFPANGHAKLVYARVLAAEGDEAAARAALSEALEIWSGADAAFVPGVEARSMLADLTAR